MYLTSIHQQQRYTPNLKVLPNLSTAKNAPKLLSAQAKDKLDIMFSGKTLVVLDYNKTASTDIPGLTALFHERSDIVPMLNTGRSLTHLQSGEDKDGRLVRDNLATFPVPYICASNEMYENTEKKPTGSWLKGLSTDQQIPEWQSQMLDSNNWSSSMVSSIIHDVLPDKVDKVHVKKTPDAKYYMTGPREILDSIGREWHERVCKALRNFMGAKPEVESKEAPEMGSLERKYSFPPDGYDKSTSLKFVLRRNPDITQVITAGNDVNDFPMLSPEEFDGKPNTALVCGKKPGLLDKMRALASQRHILYLADEGLTVSQGIRKVLDQHV